MKEIRKRSTLQETRHLLPNPLSSSRVPSSPGKETMVGHSGSLYCIMHKLMGHQHGLQVIPVTGMGDIGKTKLVTTVYQSLRTGKHFDVCGWITISQQYKIQEVLLYLLRDMGALGDNIVEELKYQELGVLLLQHLYQRRFLIVLDDMWSAKAWAEITIYLPDNSNQSRVMVTCRLQGLAQELDSSNHVKMNLLDENESWSLLCIVLYGERSCPMEFEEIGRRIARNCKGLALSIIVIGGLLARS